jgi:hypothetical protein
MEATVVNPKNIRRVEPINLLQQDIFSKMTYQMYVFSLILTWFPSKALSYASPYILMIFIFIVYNHYELLLNFIKTTIIIILFLGLNYIIRENYIFSNGILTIITYGPFILLWAMSNKSISKFYIRKIIRITYFFVLFQSSIGIIQFLIAYIKFGGYSVDMGDFIQGSIVPLSFNLEGDRGIGNAYFVINILIMTLFLLADENKNKKSYLIITLGCITVILAGVHHALISLFLGLFIALCIAEFSKALKYSLVIIPAILAAGVIFYFLNPNNVYLYSHYFNLYATGESFKTLAMKKAIIDLYQDHPNISVLGTGLGQFSSRAGLIASGTYLGGLDENRSIPFFPISQSEYFKNYAFDIYYSMKMDKSTVHGAASRTFFSLMSIYVELGIAISIAILLYLTKKIRNLKSKYLLFSKHNLNYEKNVVIIIISTILFFIFVSFFENYLEMSQATLTCFILIKIFYNKVNQPISKTIIEKQTAKYL